MALAPELKYQKVNKERTGERAQRQKDFLHHFAESGDLRTAQELTGITKNTYENWRQRFSKFATQVDRLRGDFYQRDDDTDNPNFVIFRKHYIGHDTPDHQARAVELYEGAEGGTITLLLWPPEHGKTTLTEDYFTMKLAYDPSYMITAVSESDKLTRKMLRRVKNRLDNDSPFPELIEDYGPFAPQGRTEGANRAKHAQPWGADFFDVFRKRDFDDRDYNMTAGGITSQVAGTRTNHLHLDDVQSLKSLGLTDKFVELFRQDFLSRPGNKGKTTINGTRVGDHDFYEVIEDEFGPYPWFRVVKLPAIITNPETMEPCPLWPYDEETDTGYTMENLEQRRIMVGEDAWARNYMQQPRVAGTNTFEVDAIDACRNPLLSVKHIPDAAEQICVTLDPAIGSKNCNMSLSFFPDRLKVNWIEEDTGLMRNEQIFQKLEHTIQLSQRGGARVTDVVIEAKNFQAGLARDERLLDLKRKYGFRLSEHLTGINKYDENIGVPSMASSFSLGEIELPGAADDTTRHMIDQLKAQLLAWKPLKRGNQLRQDQVMALWFGWILWMERRRSMKDRVPEFNIGGLPYDMTRVGLIVPQGTGGL
ncbi:MAG: hypothetical protein GY701_22940 [Sulfitobacter sp.]|nr:hypothetical protein [Sulfitobacter sp.]